MTKFTLCKNGIIADKTVYDRIVHGDTASVLIFSDTHGTYEAIQWIFDSFANQCEVCLFAGDGSEDIIRIVHEAAMNAAVAEHAVPPVLVLAQGNCDRERYSIALSAPEKTELFIPAYQRIQIARQNILLTHGHLCHVDFDVNRISLIAENSDCSIAVHGHTHIQSIDFTRRTVIINGGSPLRPRGKSFGGFAVLSIDAPHNTAELAFYKLLQPENGRFSATVHSTYPFKLCREGLVRRNRNYTL